MKILLVNPPYASSYGKMKSLILSYPPVGLAYLAAMLENYDVSLLDMCIKRMDGREFEKYVNDKNFDVVMFTATTPTINTVGKLCNTIKQSNENIITIVGGSHPTAIPERTLRENKSIDIIVIGEGEQTIRELIEFILGKKSLSKVKGICFRKGEKIIKTNPRPFATDLDSIPFPKHDMLNLKLYRYWHQHGKKFTGIITSRGCPARCTFCCRGVYGQQYRFRSPKNVIEEIKLLYELGVDEIHILDDNFTLIKKRCIKILEEIRKNFPDLYVAFINGVRVDTIDKEILIKMKLANTYYLGYGVESGNQKILNSVKKGISLKQVEKAVKLSKKVGIEILACFFILGLPQETRKSIVNTINFAKKLNPSFAKFSTFVPYPGTELYEKLKSEGRIRTENWDKYITYGKLVFNHPNLSDKELEYWQKKAYRDFYFSNIWWKLKNFNSFKALVKPKILKVVRDFVNFTF